MADEDEWSKVANIRGPEGPPGPPGPPGDGTPGEAGQRGSRWFYGSSTPTNIAGQLAGDMYFHTTSHDVYAYDGTNWTVIGNLRGPAA